MRVRHLQTYLNDQHMLRKSSTDNLRNVTLGIDAIYFLRNLTGHHDILSNAAGSVSPRFCHYIDEECAKFKRFNISVIFVFEGMTARSHKLFASQYQHHIDQGWNHYVNGDKEWALKYFMQVSNPCTSDLVFLLFHHLKKKGMKCIFSPYLAIAQLVYFYDEGLIDLIFGPPSVLLFDIHIVIVNFDWKKNVIDWLFLPRILKAWNINKEQFLDACLMAGTEYCLTFPYLNLPYFNGGNMQFNFGTALEFIRQAPLISYLKHFPNEEVRDNHIEGYCVCKSLIKFPVVMLVNGKVGFFNRKVNDDDESSFFSKMDILDGTVDENTQIVPRPLQQNIDSETYANRVVETESVKDMGAEKTNTTEAEKKLAWSEITDRCEKEQRNGSSGDEEQSRRGNKDKRNISKGNEEQEKKKSKCEETKKTYESEIGDNEIVKSNRGDKELLPSENKSIVANSDIMKNKNEAHFSTSIDNENKENHRDQKKSEDGVGDNEIVSVQNRNLDNISDEQLIPTDYVNVIGAKFPTGAYYLMAEGILSKKILSAIALGEWIDNSYPLIDSYEYRDAVIELRDYRCKILGLIAVKLNPFFYRRKIKFCDIECRMSNLMDPKSKFAVLDIKLDDGFLWKVNKKNVAEEMEKQNVKTVDLQFVLKWHVQRERDGISLVYKYEELDEINRTRDLKGYLETAIYLDDKKAASDYKLNDIVASEKEEVDDTTKDSLNLHGRIKKYNGYYKNILRVQNQNFNSFLALVYFMFLEKLGIFTKKCGITLFGLLLAESRSKRMDSTMLIIFELLKSGSLATQPLYPVNGKTYPQNAYTSVMNNKNLGSQDKKSVLILSRIFSLYDTKLDNQNNYEGLIDFDLCAFSSVVNIIKRTLRQLIQACVANILLANMELTDILPPYLFTPTDEHIYGFFETNYIMGVVMKYFLLYIAADVIENKKETSKTQTKNIGNEEATGKIRGSELGGLTEKNGNTLSANENKKKNKGEATSVNAYNGVTEEQQKNEHREQKTAQGKNGENTEEYGNGKKKKESKTCDVINGTEKSIRTSSKEKARGTEEVNSKEEKNIFELNESSVANDLENGASENFEKFEKFIKKQFPSVIDPVRSLCESIFLWKRHLRLIEKLENHTNVYNMVSDLKSADRFLDNKIRYVGLHKTKEYIEILGSS